MRRHHSELVKGMQVLGTVHQQEEGDMRSAALLIIMLAFSTSAFALEDSNGGHQSEQGIWLHGTSGPSPFEGQEADVPFAGAVAGERFHHQPYQTFGFKAGALRGTIDGHLIDGAAVVGTRMPVRGYVLTITAASPHRNIYTDKFGTIWQYQVSWATSNDPGEARSLCDPGYVALAVPGTWRTGQLQRDPNVFTFACVPAGGYRQCATSSCGGGAIAKCIDYGYAPWADGSAYLNHKNQLGAKFKLQKTNDSAVQLHNLCVAAMRADYDGDGHSHTINGTVLRLFDATNFAMVLRSNRTSLAALNSLSQVARTVPRSLSGSSLGRTRVGSLAMEAMWTVDKTGLAHAACLEKTRWETLDTTMTSDCDSFVRLLCSGRKGDDCELSEIPLLISYSSLIDRALYRFSDGKNSITTTQVKRTADGLVPDPAVFCPPASRTSRAAIAPSRCDCLRGFHATFEGTLLSADIGDLVTAHATHDALFANLHPLYSYRIGDCQALTTTDEISLPAFPSTQQIPIGNPAGPHVLEGYLLGAVPVESAPGFSVEDMKLSLWTLDQGAARSYVTAVAVPQGASAGSRHILGYVLRRASKDLAAGQILSKLLNGPANQGKPGAPKPTERPRTSGTEPSFRRRAR